MLLHVLERVFLPVDEQRSLTGVQDSIDPVSESSSSDMEIIHLLPVQTRRWFYVSVDVYLHLISYLTKRIVPFPCLDPTFNNNRLVRYLYLKVRTIMVFQFYHNRFRIQGIRGVTQIRFYSIPSTLIEVRFYGDIIHPCPPVTYRYGSGLGECVSHSNVLVHTGYCIPYRL